MLWPDFQYSLNVRGETPGLPKNELVTMKSQGMNHSISLLTPDQNLAKIEFSKTLNGEFYESNLIPEPSHPVNDFTFRVFFQIEMQ